MGAVAGAVAGVVAVRLNSANCEFFTFCEKMTASQQALSATDRACSLAAHIGFPSSLAVSLSWLGLPPADSSAWMRGRIGKT